MDDRDLSPLALISFELSRYTVQKYATRRGLFSICGKLVGHYPVAGWLSVSCSYVKRRAERGRWDDYVGEEAATGVLLEIGGVVAEEERRLWPHQHR